MLISHAPYRQNFLNGGPFAAIAFVLCCLFASAGPSNAYPLRGDVHLNILLCRPNDQSGPLATVADIRNKIVNRGTGGVADYFAVASNGAIDFNGSTVNGWYTLPHPTSYYTEGNRGSIESDCAAAANAQHYTGPAGTTAVTVYVTTPYLSSDGNFQAALIASCATRGCAMDDWIHEIGHGIGWRHPYSNDFHFSAGGPPGDYDDEFNVMSAMADSTSTAMSGSYGIAPPLPDAYQMDQLGWLPLSRVKTFGADGSYNENVTLVALGHPEFPGIQLLRIPVSNDPFSYYTVEMVAKDGWNSGIDKPRILIKKVQPIVVHAPNPATAYYSFLYRDQDLSGKGRGNPWSSFSLNGNGDKMSINLVSITAHHAVVHVTENAPTAAKNVYGPNTCAQGYVWRTADDADYVCVTPHVRAQTLAENRAPGAHRVAGGCETGWTLRAAYPGDRICVSTAEALATQSDNAQAPNRLAQPLRAGAYGTQ